GTGEYSDDAKRMILVERKGHISGAMRDDDLVAKAIAERCRDLRAEDRAFGIGEALALDELEFAVAAEPVVVEVILCRAKHTEPAVRIAQRDGNRPCDLRQGGDLPVTLPRQVVGGVTDPEH